MSFDYDALYRDTPDALGAPTQVFVDFFNRLEGKGLRVLDIGCGQGRDAIFIARQGHSVVGVDISPNGIRDLEVAAQAEKLNIQGQVADITRYVPEGEFDIILIDRTLHMLDRADRMGVLDRLLNHVATPGWILIADEPRNIPDFEQVFSKNSSDWEAGYAKRGYLFMKLGGSETL